jgi:hypothetical protein
MSDELLSTQEAARLLRLSPRTLEKFRVTGVGPRFHKFGRLVFYSSETLRAWTSSNLHKSTRERGDNVERGTNG